MSQSQEKSYMPYVVTTLKLLIMVVLAGGVVFGAFMAGVLYQNRASASTVMAPPPAPETTVQTKIVSADDVAPGFDVFWEAWQLVNDEFYGEIPTSDDRVHGAIRGMVNTFDDANTAYIDPVNARILQENSSGSYAGIGAAVNLDGLGRLIIVEPFVGRPAATAGVQRNDVVLEVDGEPLRGLSLYESVGLIRGPEGSTVILHILREGVDDPFDISIVREEIEIEVVEAVLLEDNIAHVSLADFSRGATEKLYEAIKDMQDQGASKLILDLRGNPGGYLDESVAVSSLFLEDAVVLRERRKGEDDEQIFETFDIPGFREMDLIVLVDRGSASASEIVAGAVKDNERGTIMGEQTFGKGTVQISHTLSDESELRVTIAQWLTPNGDFIHKNGIVPDVVIERTQADVFDGLDPQLERAIEQFKGQ